MNKLFILLLALFLIITNSFSDMVAFSMKKALKDVHKGKSADSLRSMGGITWIDGFLVDRKNRDIILLGTINSNRPALRLDDFLVALNNKWNNYDSVAGNTRYHSPPMCSIDPTQKSLAKMNTFQEGAGKTTNYRKKLKIYKKYLKSCKEKHRVSVYGIPFETNFARVMVMADYKMKSFVTGTTSDDIEGFSSYSDLFNKKSVNELKSTGIMKERIIFNRFWFVPARAEYGTHKDMYKLQEVSISLKSELEHLKASGERIQTGSIDPLSKEFSNNFDARFNKIKELNPIYQELENLYRFTTIAEVLRDLDNLNKLPYKFKSKLSRYQIEKVKVKREIKGVGRIPQEKIKIGNKIYKTFFPICGGVKIDVNPKNVSLDDPKKRSYLTLKKAVLKQRVKNAVYWTVIL